VLALLRNDFLKVAAADVTRVGFEAIRKPSGTATPLVRVLQSSRQARSAPEPVLLTTGVGRQPPAGAFASSPGAPAQRRHPSSSDEVLGKESTPLSSVPAGRNLHATVRRTGASSPEGRRGVKVHESAAPATPGNPCVSSLFGVKESRDSGRASSKSVPLGEGGDTSGISAPATVTCAAVSNGLFAGSARRAGAPSQSQGRTRTVRVAVPTPPASSRTVTVTV